jgi:hypothetical protein
VIPPVPVEGSGAREWPHGARPLISENGISTFLYELVHVAMAAPGTADDWIVEGVTEYYGLETLRRSGGIPRRRIDQAIRALEEWVEGGTLVDPSRGADSARPSEARSHLR